MPFLDNNPRNIEDLLNIFGKSSMNGIAGEVATFGSEIKASDFQQGTLFINGPETKPGGDNFFVGETADYTVETNTSGAYYNDLVLQTPTNVTWTGQGASPSVTSTNVGGQPIPVEFTDTGQVTITVNYSDSYNGSSTIQKTITVDPLPTLTVNPSSSLPFGGTEFWNPSINTNTAQVDFGFNATGGDPNTSQVAYYFQIAPGSDPEFVIDDVPTSSSQAIVVNKGDNVSDTITVLTSSSGTTASGEIIAIIEDVSSLNIQTDSIATSPTYSTSLSDGSGGGEQTPTNPGVDITSNIVFTYDSSQSPPYSDTQPFTLTNQSSTNAETGLILEISAGSGGEPVYTFEDTGTQTTTVDIPAGGQTTVFVDFDYSTSLTGVSIPGTLEVTNKLTDPASCTLELEDTANPGGDGGGGVGFE